MLKPPPLWLTDVVAIANSCLWQFLSLLPSCSSLGTNAVSAPCIDYPLGNFWCCCHCYAIPLQLLLPLVDCCFLNIYICSCRHCQCSQPRLPLLCLADVVTMLLVDCCFSFSPQLLLHTAYYYSCHCCQLICSMMLLPIANCPCIACWWCCCLVMLLILLTVDCQQSTILYACSHFTISMMSSDNDYVLNVQFLNLHMIQFYPQCLLQIKVVPGTKSGIRSTVAYTFHV